MTDLIERAKATLEGYTDDDIKDSEHLSFARLAVAAAELETVAQKARDEIAEAFESIQKGGSAYSGAVPNIDSALARFRAIAEGRTDE